MVKALLLVGGGILALGALIGLVRFGLYLIGICLIKHMVNRAEAFGRAHPRRIHLLPRDLLSWEHPEQVAATVQTLQQAGFVDAGCYEIQEIAGVKLHGLVHPDLHITAIVYDHAKSTFLDLSTRYQDGRQITYSNHTMGFSTPRPEHMAQKIIPGATVAELLERCNLERPAVASVPVPPERFTFHIEQEHAEHQRWLNQRGGPTLDELRLMTQAAAEGQGVDEETLHELYEQSAQACLLNWYRDQPGMTETAWDDLEHRLVVVHEGLRPQQVVELFNQSVPDKKELSLAGFPHHPDSPREAFALFNEHAGRLFTKVKIKTDPLAADFYLEPDWQDDGTVRAAATPSDPPPPAHCEAA